MKRSDLHRVYTTPAHSPRGVRELVAAPLRRPWLVVVPFVLCAVAATLATFVVQKRYRSETLILIESQTVPESFVTRVATERARRSATLKQEILSRTRLEKIIKELDPYPAAVARGGLSAVVESMREDVTVVTRGNDSFTIAYVHTDPHTAMQVTNRLASLFIEEAAASRESQVQGTSQFIESQLEEARRELEAQEEAVRKYKQQHMGALPEQLTANLATLSRLQLEQQTVGEGLRAAQDRLTLIESQRSSPGAVPSGSDPEMELHQLRAQREALRARYTDEHPEVAALLARIARLEQALPTGAAEQPGRAGSQIAQARLEVDGLKARRGELDRRVAEYQLRVEQAPRAEQELASLTRDFQRLNENYLALLGKKLDAQMAAKLEKRWVGDHFKVLDPAPLPEEPFYPRRSTFLLAGMLAGLALGLGLSVAVEAVDHSIKNVGDLESILPCPVLVSVPHIDLSRRALPVIGRS